MKKEFKLERGYCLETYTNLRKLFEDINPEFLESLSEDENTTIDHVLDFENYLFLVVSDAIDGAAVINVYDGVISGIYNVEKITELTRKIISDCEE